MKGGKQEKNPDESTGLRAGLPAPHRTQRRAINQAGICRARRQGSQSRRKKPSITANRSTIRV